MKATLTACRLITRHTHIYAFTHIHTCIHTWGFPQIWGPFVGFVLKIIVYCYDLLFRAMYYICRYVYTHNNGNSNIHMRIHTLHAYTRACMHTWTRAYMHTSLDLNPEPKFLQPKPPTLIPKPYIPIDAYPEEEPAPLAPSPNQCMAMGVAVPGYLLDSLGFRV